ncbi:hypothetical protein [Flavobacterium sp.]|uniref:hypothetical protein n=1 Tax=Flavobacterium sp. TaxID=239 RepID=UPI002B4B625E|nr:hypothetical protein [Flavobacterium sp.]HLP64744.1 hypothetical protein [Flavobacterium sp.]
MKYLLLVCLTFSSCHSQNEKKIETEKDSISRQNQVEITVDKMDSLVAKIKKTDNYRSITFSDSLFRFSNHTLKSKVSVFVVSSETCAPCHIIIDKLKKKLDEDSLYQSKVKLFVIKIPNSRKEKTEYESIGYQVFKNIDNLAEVLPTTYIFAPTENQYCKIVGENYSLITKNIETLIPFCK